MPPRESAGSAAGLAANPRGWMRRLRPRRRTLPGNSPGAAIGVRASALELAFLPALVEIQETPPSPAARAVSGVIILLFLAAVLWSGLGHYDIVTVAQGSVVPDGRSKLVQPLEAGTIVAIHVRDGDLVRQGQVLIELDPTSTEADRKRLDNERSAAELEAARLQALIVGERQMSAPAGTDPEHLALALRLLDEGLTEHESRMRAAALAVERQQAAVAALRLQIERLETTQPLLAERAEALRAMLKDRHAARLDYLAAEAERVARTLELKELRQRLRQEEAALNEARLSQSLLPAEFRRRHLAELSAARTRLRSLRAEEQKARRRHEHQSLRAPIDGLVQQLAVHTVGGVVTPAQTLLVVVPDEGALEVEAWVENKDIGSLAPGQVAEVKLEAFPFTRYGTLPGRVLGLSRDAVSVDQAGLLYVARIALEQSSIRVENDRRVPVSPGMRVSVEVKTGQRRLIEYFLSPILRGLHESMRER